MNTESRILRVRLFLRYSSNGLISVIFFYAGLKLVEEQGTWMGVQAFMLLAGIVLLWGVFRLYSIHSMSRLTGQVLKGMLTYEELFSVEVSQRRLIKVLFHTAMTAGMAFYVIYLVAQYSESAIGWILISLLTAAIMTMNYIRARSVFTLTQNRQQIELNRAATAQQHRHSL